MDSELFLWWLFCTILGGAIGIAKGQVVSGAIWGGLIGPIGIIIFIFIPNTKKQKK